MSADKARIVASRDVIILTEKQKRSLYAATSEGGTSVVSRTRGIIREYLSDHTEDGDAYLVRRLRELAAEHAPHGFTGHMRTAEQGCAVYLAASTLADHIANGKPE